MSKKPGEWSLDDCDGVIDDSYQWPTLETMTDKDMLDSIKRLKNKALKEKDKDSIFYKMTIDEIFTSLKAKIKSSKKED